MTYFLPAKNYSTTTDVRMDDSQNTASQVKGYKLMRKCTVFSLT